MTPERCPNSWFGSHKFEPRYDLGEPDTSRFVSFKAKSTTEFFDGLKSKTYVRDVCVKCGKAIDRPRVSEMEKVLRWIVDGNGGIHPQNIVKAAKGALE